MQVWSQAATLAKNSLASDTPFLLLVEVISKELAEPICLVRNTENIVWRDKFWTAFPVEIESTSEDGKTIPSINIRISNCGGMIGSYIQQYNGLVDSEVRIALREKGPENKAKFKNRYVYSGKVFCGKCLSILKHKIQHTGDKEYPLLACPRHISDKDKCSQKAVKEAAFKDAFCTMINKLICVRNRVLKPLLQEMKNTRATVDSNAEAEMLQNEKYIGDNLTQKTITVDTLNKIRRVNKGDADQYYIKNSHPAIIERQVFEAIGEEIKRRRKLWREKRKVYASKYALADVLVCGSCDSKFYRVTRYMQKKHYVWVCGKRLYGKDDEKCEMRIVREEQVYEYVLEAMISGGISMAGGYNDELIRKYIKRVHVFEDYVLVDLDE